MQGCFEVAARRPPLADRLLVGTLSEGFCAASTSRICSVADEIEAGEGGNLLRGHGTKTVGGMLVSTVCGLVDRINQLVTVRNLSSRYAAETGDVVVGRVLEVSGKKWRVDLGSRHEAALLLSAVHLPGGVQRRRTAEDELSMRELFREGDLVLAEVQSVQHDGTVMLHTRHAEFGRLRQGQAVTVPASLVKRQQRHIQRLTAGLDMVLGCNGVVWLAPYEQPKVGMHSADCRPAADELQACSRGAQAVATLAAVHHAVHPAAVELVYELSLRREVLPKDMLSPQFLEAVVAEWALCNAQRGAE